MAIKANVGDVFLVPVDGKRWAVGQVVSSWNEELYVAIFDNQVGAQRLDVPKIVDMSPVFLALTLDAKIWNGDWPIIGNIQENLSEVPQPAFKVREEGYIKVESRDRRVKRVATPSEAAILRYRSVASPAIIEEAVQNYFGSDKRSSRFDKFKSDYAYRSAQILRH